MYLFVKKNNKTFNMKIFNLKKKIIKIYNKKKIKKKNRKIILKGMSYLNKGIISTIKKTRKKYKVNKWVKKIIILFFKIKKNFFLNKFNFVIHDKFKNKYSDKNKKYFKKKNIRITNLSFARYGSYISNNVIMMPCFVNVGARIGSNTLIDSWSTVGSCAIIGKNVHLSGGVGIGGVLEPINKKPVIIENNCFIGARSEIVEGVIIKKNSVIAMGVYIGSSTKIYDRINHKFYNSYIPKNSVVVSGCLNYGFYSLYSVIIVKKRDIGTKKKIKKNKNLIDNS
ncbi:2,3,4,5-tetrahydropyridine-2,6-dicarboxylate N-succinyltransferase [Candidatus Vidania fulgoroideorum]